MPDKIKILLVEDDPMIVKMYQRKLKMDDFELVIAFNGQEGLDALKTYQPDIVLLDIMMPKMNGLETLKILKQDERYKDIPVVILTNLGDRAEDMQKCKELGAEDYWVKANMSLEEISRRVKEILAKKK